MAALVHDIGHLLPGSRDDHEVIGNQWLRSRFGPAVTEPVRLHVDAKRYLCSVDPDYFTKLSAASMQSLKVQGGPYSKPEVSAFGTNEWFQDAVALRRWDDAAKTPGLVVPGLRIYRAQLINASETRTDAPARASPNPRLSRSSI